MPAATAAPLAIGGMGMVCDAWPSPRLDRCELFDIPAISTLGAAAPCSATPKSCLFLGRHARQRRSLVSSSGGMLGNAEVLFLPRALIESKTFYRPQHVGFIERNIFSLADNVTFNCPLSVLLKWRGTRFEPTKP